MIPEPVRAPHRARTGVLLFLVLIPLLVAGPIALRAAAARGSAAAFACLVVLTWTPALASLIARAVLREGLADVSFALPAMPVLGGLMTALATPLAIGLAGYGAAWGSGLARFDLPAATPWPAASPALRFGAFLAINLARGLPLLGFLALGEEIGWRGYLLPRLIESGWPRPVLLSGLVWGLWHVPSLLWGGYPAGPNRPLSAAVILVTLGAFAFVLARLRLESGSIWPPTLAHAAWNSIILDSFDGATHAPTAWTRESGILVALATLITTLWITRGTWNARLSPASTPFALVFGRR